MASLTTLQIGRPCHVRCTPWALARPLPTPSARGRCRGHALLSARSALGSTPWPPPAPALGALGHPDLAALPAATPWGARDVFEGGRHSPFQVLDASAIEGIRGLVVESSSIYSCIQIYKALTPPAPSVSRRNGRTWASILRGILRGATLPRSRAVRSPVCTPAGVRRRGRGGLKRDPRN